ncbi:MAG: glucose 1-dehydrogenase [Alicyclobacillus sp.]|nr:glucose 1-dehydrogenase [Alicyclobacillus sp.]
MNWFRLDGRRVVVTGASRGIGRGLALGFAAAGADVVLVARDREALASVADEIRSQHPSLAVETVACDLRDVASVRAAAEEIEREGRVDVLVNNAGMNIRTPALQVTEAEWQAILDTDLRGAFFLAQQFGRGMVERRRGSVINVSSVGGAVALRTGVAYAAAKAGVIQMTKVLAIEWGPYNVRVNGIAPWYFRTPLTQGLLDNPDYRSEVVGRTPLRRVGEIDELVGPAVFLASNAASYVTGHTLFVDGGMTIYGF